MDNLILGTLVYSKAGRDKGRPFVVVATEGSNYVYLADGKTHKIGKPKKKKLMHLRFTSCRVENINEVLSTAGGAQDSHLRRAMAALLADRV